MRRCSPPTGLASHSRVWPVPRTTPPCRHLLNPSPPLHSQFLPVKPRFVHGKITDTVLGILHLAICDPTTGRALGVLFDVFNGERYCTLKLPGAPEFGGSQQVQCAPAFTSFGMSISEEGFACSLQSMKCGHVPKSKLPAMLRDPSTVPLSMARFNVSVGGTRLSLLRDLIDHPELPIDCAPLATLARAHKACETIARVLGGLATEQEAQGIPQQDRVAVMAYLTAGNTSQQMHFHNVRVEAMPFPQSEVHGLLGQRAVGPVPPIATTNKLAARNGSLVSTEQLSADGSTTIRATVAADGTAPPLQGEGAIEGPYTSYNVRRPSSLWSPLPHTLTLPFVPCSRSSIFRCMARERSRTRASSARHRRSSRVIEKYLTWG